MTTPTSTRRNAAIAPPKAAKRRATGPRTAAGKRRSSRNALKHGILSAQIVRDGHPEERALYHAMHQSLIDEFAPATMMETILVERIAICYWRMRRLVIAENQATYSATQSDRVASRLFREDPNPDPRALPTHSTLALYSRYDVTLERQLYRAMEQLARLRREREAPHHLADPPGRGDRSVAHLSPDFPASPVDPSRRGDRSVAHLSPDNRFLRNELGGADRPGGVSHQTPPECSAPPQPLEPLECHTHAGHAAFRPLPSLLVGTTGDYHAGEEPCFAPDEGILPNFPSVSSRRGDTCVAHLPPENHFLRNELEGRVLPNSPGVQHPKGAAKVATRPPIDACTPLCELPTPMVDLTNSPSHPPPEDTP